MKLFFVVIFFAGVFSSCSTTIYVVRHAEKQTGSNNSMMTADPDLTENGKLRAKALADTLATKKITAVFATQYKRTQQTAEPTAALKSTSIKVYDAAKSGELIDSLSHWKNKGYLVVSHSNTILPMLLKLGLHPSMQEIADNDFDNLFVVRIKWFLKRTIGLKESTYGKVSP